jgi:hypothetical protein
MFVSFFNVSLASKPAVALCFQPTHFESEKAFGNLRCSSAIANVVTKMHTRQPPRWSAVR